MELSSRRHLLLEKPAAHVWLARFTRPDLRAQLDGAGVEDCELYKDLQEAILCHFKAGDWLVLNFGIVSYFPTSFYQLLLGVRHEIMERKGHLLLCSLEPETEEAMRVMRAEKVFEIMHTEDYAIRRATHA